jgi:3-hydroxyacyl-[acyl-carrier-protein] dehydratase
MNPLQREIQTHLSQLTSGADGEFTAKLTFPADFSGFKGHFPGNPILPGVCMVQAVLAALAAHRGAPVTLRKIVFAKWFQPVKPDTELRFLCRAKLDAAGETAVRARLFRGAEAVADLSLLVAGDQGGPS